MRNATEEEILRDLDSRTPHMTDAFSGTLRDLARLAQLIKDDAEAAVRCEGDECRDSLYEIDRKCDLLHDWLISKADEWDDAKRNG